MIYQNKNLEPKNSFALTFGVIAVFLSLIPWYSFGLLSSDSMPWPFIGYLLFLFSLNHHIKLPKNFIVMFLILLVGIYASLFISSNILDENIFRSLYNYFGVVIFYIGFYNYLLKYGFPNNIFILCNILWLSFGLVELFFPEIASIFSKTRTDEHRGVTSLAPEPTFFGMYLFFSSWLMILGQKHSPSRLVAPLILINLASIFFLAQSSMIILYLLISLIVFFIYAYFRLVWRKQFLKRTFYIALIILIVTTIINQTEESTRFLSLYSQLQNELNLKLIFYVDGSLNSRLEHIVYSLHGSINNFLIPAGFDTFIKLGDVFDSVYGYYFYNSPPSNKIMSWHGDWLYQLGFFGLIFVSYLFFISSDGSRMRRFELLLLAILLLSAVPLAFPLISMILAMYTYQSKISNYSNEKF